MSTPRSSQYYFRQGYDSGDSSSDDSDPFEYQEFPEDQKRYLKDNEREISRIQRKIERLEKYGVPLRANDKAFLSLEDSLSVTRWILQEQIETKRFAYSFIFMVFIPLFICFPLYMATSAEYWDKLYANDDGTSCESNNFCVPGKDVMQIIWHSTVWLPLVWLLVYGNFSAITIVRLQHAWYFDLKWDSFRKKLEQRKRQGWESNTERTKRWRREAKIAHYKRRLKRLQRQSDFCICFPGFMCSRSLLDQSPLRHNLSEETPGGDDGQNALVSSNSEPNNGPNSESKKMADSKQTNSDIARQSGWNSKNIRYDNYQSAEYQIWHRRLRVCGPCICKKRKCQAWIVFFCFCVLPLGTLLPVWFAATLNPDVVDLSMDINGPMGRLVFLIACASVSGIYLIVRITIAVIGYMRRRSEQRRTQDLKRKASRKLRKMTLSIPGQRGHNLDKVDGRSPHKGVGNAKLRTSVGTKLHNEVVEGVGGLGGAAAAEEEEEKEEETELANPDPKGRRVLKQKHLCTPKFFTEVCIGCIFFVVPLILGLLAYFRAPKDFFATTLSKDYARLLVLIFAIAPPYFWFLFRGLGFTLVDRWPKAGGGTGGSGVLSKDAIESMRTQAESADNKNSHRALKSATTSSQPLHGRKSESKYDNGNASANWDDLDGESVRRRRKMYFTNNVGASPRFRTLWSRKAALEKQMLLDEQFCFKLKWPRWLLYHYPRWSIGHGLITTGERRRLVGYSKYSVDIRRLVIVSIFLFWIPVLALFPIYYQLGDEIAAADFDPSQGISLRVVNAFMLGYPSTFVMFYVTRLIWGIIPAPVKSTFPTVGLHFFIFVVVPLGVLAPIYESRQLSFSEEVALFANVVIYAFPASFFAIWLAALTCSLPSVWKWIISIRLEPYILKGIMKILLRGGVIALVLPLPLFVFSSILLGQWEDKDQVALSTFVIISAVSSFLILFFGIFSIVAAQWLGHVERIDGIESIIPVVGFALAGINASWGASVLDKFVLQAFPNIMQRIDENDSELRAYTVYAQPLYFATGALSALYYVNIYRRSVDMLRRFGRHPEEWEKDDPSLLTRGLTEMQQQAVQDIEWEEMHKLAVAKERERSWLARPAPVDSDDEYESLVEYHTLNKYMRIAIKECQKSTVKNGKLKQSEIISNRSKDAAENELRKRTTGTSAKEIELSSKSS